MKFQKSTYVLFIFFIIALLASGFYSQKKIIENGFAARKIVEEVYNAKTEYDKDCLSKRGSFLYNHQTQNSEDFKKEFTEFLVIHKTEIINYCKKNK